MTKPWEDFKVLIEYYWRDGVTLNDLPEVMELKHGFQACRRAYAYQLSKWGLSGEGRNISNPILRKHHRQQVEKRPHGEVILVGDGPEDQSPPAGIYNGGHTGDANNHPRYVSALLGNGQAPEISGEESVNNIDPGLIDYSLPGPTSPAASGGETPSEVLSAWDGLEDQSDPVGIYNGGHTADVNNHPAHVPVVQGSSQESANNIDLALRCYTEYIREMHGFCSSCFALAMHRAHELSSELEMPEHSQVSQAESQGQHELGEQGEDHGKSIWEFENLVDLGGNSGLI